ncbi:MAG TPA: FAD:protein FMN transferase [Vicinamibacteria bacterium]|nr:FAD:protein FMN transferase [Vicinamibacteria bacterium]
MRAFTRRELFSLGRADADDEGGWIRVHRAAMACRFEVLLDDGDARHVGAAREALDEADRVEAALSVFRPTSDLSRVNATAAAGAAATSDELFALLGLCRALHERTQGAFDITSTPLSRAWGFLDRDGRLPGPEALAAARTLVSMSGVHLDAAARTVRFARPGMELNLGSIGKGHALDRMAGLMRARGVSHALLSAGGSSAVAVGGRGRGWVVDVRSRQVANERLARLRLRDGALATSGAGEQFFEIEGRRYGHVIDPRSGWPAAGVLSVTVVTAQAAMSDALSTAFLVGGIDVARPYCAAHPETLALITLDDAVRRPIVLGAYAGARLEEA